MDEKELERSYLLNTGIIIGLMVGFKHERDDIWKVKLNNKGGITRHRTSYFGFHDTFSWQEYALERLDMKISFLHKYISKHGVNIIYRVTYKGLYSEVKSLSLDVDDFKKHTQMIYKMLTILASEYLDMMITYG